MRRPGWNGQEGLNPRAVVNLGRVAARVLELEQVKHHALLALLAVGLLPVHAGGVELTLHLVELLRPGHAPADEIHVVVAVQVHDDAVMLIVHAQVEAIAVALVQHLHAEPPDWQTRARRRLLDADAQVSEFRYLRHVQLLRGERRLPDMKKARTGMITNKPRRRVTVP